VRMSAQLRNNMAEILLEQGRAAEAKHLFLEGADELSRVGDKELLPHLIAGAAEADLELGDVEAASLRIGTALSAAEASNDPLTRLEALRIAGRIAHEQGRSAEAHEHFDAALKVADSVRSPLARSKVAYDYARVLEADGDGSQAILRYREAYESRRIAPGA